jgi:hypothetical protein
MNNEKPPPGYQPPKCKGCVWGNWDGVRQFCSRIKCVKPNEVDSYERQAKTRKEKT